MNKIFLCSVCEINKKKYFIKFIEEIKDEIIAFIDKETNEIKIFSSICPHFGGEIFYNQTENSLQCKWHNWKFCRISGKCLSFPIKGSLNPYNFEISPKDLNRYNSEIKDNNIFLII
jgi:nitrite reductase/ring-hydroxylating ferredoxin subunit